MAKPAVSETRMSGRGARRGATHLDPPTTTKGRGLPNAQVARRLVPTGPAADMRPDRRAQAQRTAAGDPRPAVVRDPQAVAGRHGDARRSSRRYCTRMREIGAQPAPYGALPKHV